MAARASWKGHLKVGDLTCAVGLYTAVSFSDRVSFHIINRRTGHRVERQFVDSETGKPVERDDQSRATGWRMATTSSSRATRSPKSCRKATRSLM